MNLTPSQRQATQRIGQDVCVVAGPGSGKTRVLVERFCWLVKDKGVSPLRVLAITFTEKAATQIKQRLIEAFAGRPELREQIERAYVSTIHGFCVRLLRENPITASVDPEFTVLDDPQSQAGLEEAAHEALDQLFHERPSDLRYLLDAIYASTDLARSLLSVYQAMRTIGLNRSGTNRSRAHQQAVRPDATQLLATLLSELHDLLAKASTPISRAQSGRLDSLREWIQRASGLTGSPVSAAHFVALADLPHALTRLASRGHLKQIRDERVPSLEGALASEFYAMPRTLLCEALERTDRIYRQRKRDISALDFSDLEERAIELLNRNPAVCDSVRQSFDQILMDELQDTNRLQWTLLNLLRTPNRFFAVGDINQSIYGFRHADPDVFREYRDQIATQGRRIDELFENHRSRKEILSTVDLVAGRVQGIEPHHLEPARTFADKAEPSVELIVGCRDTTEEATRVEAHQVARRIRELAGNLAVEDKSGQRPCRFRDIAVLVRTVNALGPLEQAFQQFHIPYLTEGGRTFYEAREVKDLVHLLRTIANPWDEIGLAGVLRSLLVGISDETLLRLKQNGNLGAALARQKRADPSLFDAEDLERLCHFRDQLRRMRSERDDVSPDRLLARAIDDAAYESSLDLRARANVDKFLALVRDWYRRKPRSLDELLQELEWLRTSASETDAPPDDSSDVVRLMTIHKAKGLQFPVVFLPALHKGINRSKPPICLSREADLGVRWRNPATGEPLADLAHRLYSRELKQKEEAEENRLFYVAMTRAEEHLVLSFAKAKRLTSEWSRMVTDGLGVGLDTIDKSAVIHVPRVATFPVRVLRTDVMPEPLAELARPAVEQEEALLLPRPPVTDQHDSTASVTSIATFETCPRRYFLGRYLGWRDTPRAPGPPEEMELFQEPEEFGTPDAAEFGRQVHSLLAGGPTEGTHPEALELVLRFQSSDLGQRAARSSRAEREFDFLMAVEDVVLRGQVDLWFEEGEELVLVDYKTDDVGADATWDRAQSYALQLRLYALALERFIGRLPDQAYVCLLRPDRVVPIQLEAPLLEAAVESVRTFRQAQSDLRFDLREGEHCFGCQFYRGLCPAGKAQVATAAARRSSFPAPS